MLNRMLFGMRVSRYALNKKVLKHFKELVLNVYYTFTAYSEISIFERFMGPQWLQKTKLKTENTSP